MQVELIMRQGWECIMRFALILAVWSGWGNSRAVVLGFTIAPHHATSHATRTQGSSSAFGATRTVTTQVDGVSAQDSGEHRQQQVFVGTHNQQHFYGAWLNARGAARRRSSVGRLFAEDQSWIEALRGVEGDSGLPMGPKKVSICVRGYYWVKGWSMGLSVLCTPAH